MTAFVSGPSRAIRILIALALRDLATGLPDVELRGQIQTATDKVFAKNGRAVGRA